MQLNEKLQERQYCLDECARTEDRCETGSESGTPCRDGFEQCTVECELDHA